MLGRNLRAQSKTENHERDQRVSVQSEALVEKNGFMRQEKKLFMSSLESF